MNGVEYAMEDYNSAMRAQGYVLQTDSFFEELTVRQSLLISAAMKEPRREPQEVAARVTTLMRSCQLTPCADNRIGGITFKGISGGQRRRLSIAEQMLGGPAVLLLDEPTSGLDSTSSLKLVQLLRGIAEQDNRVICTTIHQPRPEIFDLFTHIILLAEGGHVAYFGPANEAVPFLVAAGVGEFRDSDSPGDFIIDALGLDAERDGKEGMRKVDLPTAYRSSPVCGAMHREQRALALGRLSKVRHQFPTSAWEQTVYLFARRLARGLSTWKGTAVSYGVLCLTGAIISAAFGYDSSVPGRSYQQLMFIMLIVCYIQIQQYLVSTPEIYAERNILRKERESGDCRLGSYLAVLLLSETPRAVLQTTLMLVCGYANPSLGLNTGADRVWFFWICMLVGVLSWQAIISLICFSTDDIGAAYSIQFIVMGIGALFGGVMIPYDSIAAWWWTGYVLPFRWGYFASVQAFTFRSIITMNADKNPSLDMNCAEFVDFGKLTALLLAPGRSAIKNNPNLTLATEQCNEGQLKAYERIEGYAANGTINIGLPMLAIFGWHYLWAWCNLIIMMAVMVLCRVLPYFVQLLRDRREGKLGQIAGGPDGASGGGRSPRNFGPPDDQEMLGLEVSVSKDQGGGSASRRTSRLGLPATLGRTMDRR